MFVRLCEAMGRPELADDPRFATHGGRGENMAELDALVGGVDGHGALRRAPRDAATRTACPAGRIFTAPDMLTDPQYLARDMVRRVTSTQGWEVPMTGVVPRFTGDAGHDPPPRAHARRSTPTRCSPSCSGWAATRSRRCASMEPVG